MAMTEVSPIHYKMHLEPDLDAFTFAGVVELQAALERKGNEIALNAAELAVWGCEAAVGGRLVACPFRIDPAKEELRIILPQEMEGDILLRIEYVGRINDRMAGFYRSRYEMDDATRYIAVTQFEESDARRALPCFDHPAHKATFDLEMLIPEELQAYSNTPIAQESLREGRKKLVAFQRTPKMSSYLLFFAVGSFETIEAANGVAVRAITVPGMTKYARFGLDFGRKALRYCADALGTEYPLAKLDLIAVPDFAFGAMENWGAVTFRENLLLHYPEITSRAGEESICGVVAHEIVHQWFGNLVTPSDWKYLWLNESFATYFGNQVVAHYHPGWEIWDQFLDGQTGPALDRDALQDTVPIEIPGGDHVIINVSTAPIIYNKGGSILRQIEGFLGRETFRRGLQHYLKRYEYGSAASNHLWEALEAFSEEPVTDIMRSWIEQPGYPIVEAKRRGRELLLEQQRFTYLPGSSGQSWLIPLSVRVFSADGGSQVIKTLLKKRSETLDLETDAVAFKVNDDQNGFYRVKYRDKGDLVLLGECMLDYGLSAPDRWGLQNDLFALVRRGDYPFGDYLDYLKYYREEDGFLPLVGIADTLHHAYLVLGEPWRDRIPGVGKPLLERVISKIGCVPDPGEKHSTSTLRDRILWLAALFGSDEVESFALNRFKALRGGKAVPADIKKSVMQVAAMHGDRSTFQWLVDRFRKTDSEHERMNVLSALGRFRDTQWIEAALQYTLDEVPQRNKFVPITAMAGNPYAVPKLWDWFATQLDRLEQFHPIHFERVIASLVPICGLGREEEVRTFLLDYVERTERARDAVVISLERLKINGRMRSAEREPA
jgi:aminopeptidase N